MPWTYRPSLDGLRSVAVYLVLLFHTGLAATAGGFVGVDLFFVLSGFLVTSVILSEVDRTGHLDVGGFYARRVRRLLPAAVVVVVATALVFLLVGSVVRRIPLVEDAQSALLYYSNWHFLGQSNDYFAAAPDKSPYLHYWSLSIEEQFYLVFPLVILLVVLAVRKRQHLLNRVLLVVLGLLFVLSVAAQVYWAGIDTNRAYYGTDTRLYQLLAGALVALVLRSRQPRIVRLTRWRPGLVALVGLVAVVVVASGLVDWTPSVRGLGATAASAVAIAGLMRSRAGLASRVLSSRLPVYLGKISYGIYLWHWPVIVVLGQLLVLSPVALTAMTIPIATALAALSSEVLEMPIRTSRLLKPWRWTVLVTGVGASALVAATLVPSVLRLDVRPQLVTLQSSGFSSSSGVVGDPVTVPENVDWQAVRQDVGDTRACTAADWQDCIVVRGTGPHVLVVGDSHAQMLYDMFVDMATTHDLTLSLNIEPGCPWQEELMNAKLGASTDRLCQRLRVGWYEQVLPLLKPDVVILVDRQRDDASEWEELVTRRDGRVQPYDQMVFEATHHTLDKLERLVPRVLIVDSLVMPNTFQPNDCLTSMTDTSRCGIPIPTVPPTSDGYYDAAAAASPNTWSVNLNPAFCPDAPVCEPVVDGQIVYRDDHHFTASYAASRMEEVWQLLLETGVFDGLPGISTGTATDPGSSGTDGSTAGSDG